MLAENSDATWERYGLADPYFGVISQERFRRDRLDAEARAAFFLSGAEEVHLIRTVFRRQFGIHPFQVPVGLDFGCGVGRLLVPLARFCERTIGVDVSQAMLDEARRNCTADGLTNVDLVRGDDSLSGVRQPLDYVQSLIVFQHIEPRRGMKIFRTLLDRLNDGGLGAVHFTFDTPHSVPRRAYQWLKSWMPLVRRVVNRLRGRRPTFEPMEMNAYSLSEICALLQEQGCRNSYLHFTYHDGHRGAIVFFRKGTHRPSVEVTGYETT